MADSSDLKQYSTWYIAMLAAGALIAAPAATTGNNDALLIGLGLILIGAGEFSNHPYQEMVQFDDYGQIVAKVTGRVRQWRLGGTCLDLIGAALFLLGLYRVAF